MKTGIAFCSLLLSLWLPPSAWALYSCQAVLDGQTTVTGTLQTGWTLKQTLAITCTRSSTEPAHPSNRNRPSMQLDLGPSTAPFTSAQLMNGGASAPYAITVGSLNNTSASATEPSCSSLGAPTSLSSSFVVYSQTSAGSSLPALTFSSNSATSTGPRYIKVCFAAPAISGPPAGTYSQGLTYRGLVLGINNNQIKYTDQTLSAVVAASCSIQTSPGNISLNYPSFAANTVIASTNAAVNCSDGLKWKATIDPTSGTLRGILYSLTLSDGLNPTQSGTGTGTLQNLFIYAKALAAQAGTTAPCAAPCTITHVLTIEY